MSWLWNRGQRSLKVIETDTNRSATYDFLLTFHSNNGTTSLRFRDRRRFQSKIAKFSYPRRDSLRIGYRRSCSKKTRIMGLPGRERSLTISSALCIQYTNVTDGQTDGRTRCHSKDRASRRRAGKKPDWKSAWMEALHG